VKRHTAFFCRKTRRFVAERWGRRRQARQKEKEGEQAYHGCVGLLARRSEIACRLPDEASRRSRAVASGPSGSSGERGGAKASATFRSGAGSQRAEASRSPARNAARAARSGSPASVQATAAAGASAKSSRA